jgi:hypothetical protein
MILWPTSTVGTQDLSCSDRIGWTVYHHLCLSEIDYQTSDRSCSTDPDGTFSILHTTAPMRLSPCWLLQAGCCTRCCSAPLRGGYSQRGVPVTCIRPGDELRQGLNARYCTPATCAPASTYYNISRDPLPTSSYRPRRLLSSPPYPFLFI